MTIKSVTLGDIADFVLGQAPPGNTVSANGGGVPFYRSGEFGIRRPHLVAWTTKPLRISPSDSVWVCVVGNNAGDINLGVQGAIGRSVAAVVPREGVDYLYLYYHLRFRENWLRSQAAGSAQPVLSSTDLARIEISLPSLPEQRAIAATLGALDDKIESNRRVQHSIENLLRALVGRALLSASAGDATLADYCKLVKDPAAVSELDSDSSYIGFEHMPKGSIALSDWGTQDGLASAKSRFMAGDVLFGKLRPYFKKVGIAPVEGVCSNDILVLRPNTESVRALVAVVASSDDLIDHVSSAATGTRMPRASWSDVSKWAVPKLSQTEIEVLGELTNPLVNLLQGATHENRRLISLRDTLLPELLSGRIRVAEAAEQVESAL